MSRLECCPLCLTEVPGWAAACPKCHYHPDAYYNRAQDDVALIFRLNSESGRSGTSAAAPASPPAPSTPTTATAPATAPATTASSWRSWLSHWLGGAAGNDAHPPSSAA